MQFALGKTPEEEQKPGLSKLAHTISGTRGLLFTDKSEEEVKKYFDNYRADNFARAGFTCTRSYKLAAGTLPADRCPHPMEPLLRKLGLPTKLVQGRVELLNDVAVVAHGDVMTPEQCKIMQIFGVKLATFRMHLLYTWKEGAVSEVEGDDTAEEQGEQDGEDAAPIELRDVAAEGAYVEEEEDDEAMAGGAAAADDDDAEL